MPKKNTKKNILIHVELDQNFKVSQEYKKTVAEIKFKDDPSCRTHTKGHIVLQDRGNSVWCRNIEIRMI